MLPINSRAWPVCVRRRQVGVRACAALGRELEHLRSERGDHPPAGGHLRGVERVQVLDQHVVGLAVLVGVLGMPDADAEQEPAGVGVLDAVVRLGDLSAGAVHTLTMPVATCSVSVCSSIGST